MHDLFAIESRLITSYMRVLYYLARQNPNCMLFCTGKRNTVLLGVHFTHNKASGDGIWRFFDFFYKTKVNREGIAESLI